MVNQVTYRSLRVDVEIGVHDVHDSVSEVGGVLELITGSERGLIKEELGDFDGGVISWVVFNAGFKGLEKSRQFLHYEFFEEKTLDKIKRIKAEGKVVFLDKCEFLKYFVLLKRFLSQSLF